MRFRANALVCVIAAAIGIFSGQRDGSAAVPAWVQPGVTAVYQGFQGNVVVLATSTINNRSGDAVSGTPIVRCTGGSVCGNTYNWNCTSSGPDCGGFQFWVDTANPTASFTGPNGEILSVQGSAPIRDGNGTTIGNGVTYNAVSMAYTDPQNGFTVHVEYEAASGLLLSYSQMPNPVTEEFFLTFNGGAAPPSGNALTSAVLPSSRSVKVGAAAAAFATIINSAPPRARAAACLPGRRFRQPSSIRPRTRQPMR
jgi:hypothetical protein